MRVVRTKRSLWLHRINRYVLPIFVIGGATLIFILRNTAAFQIPNFYAEDATVYLNNIYSYNPLHAVTTLFNGYLVIGQYIVGYLGVAINHLLGGHFVNLPLSVALASCIFLGFTVSLPFLLFRKELGTNLSIALVIASAFVPLALSDYAVIGTLGNLKFAFVYIAFLLLLYRNLHHQERSVFAIDVALLICVFTNVTVAFMLPFGLLSYSSDILSLLKKKASLFRKNNIYLFSFLVTAVVSMLYILVVYIHGIPTLPGYLDQPFQRTAVGPVLDRSTSFAWLYPITHTFNNFVVAGIIILGLVAGWKYSKNDRSTFIFGIVTISLASGLFILNRPGIGGYFLTYGHKGGPDQFFYAQNLTVIFVTFWLVRKIFSRFSTRQQLLSAFSLLLYLVWAIPFGTSFGGSRVVYEKLGTVNSDLKMACAQKTSPVTLQIYPTPYWQWHVNRDRACRDL
jgi:hypothetical protein